MTYFRFPLTLVALFFAIAAALVLGGVLGYELRPATLTAEPHQIIVEQPGPVATPSCVWVASHKGC